MAMCKLKDVELYYEEYGTGDNVVILAQQFVCSSMNFVKELSEKYGFHGYVIRIRGYAPSTLITEDLGTAWYDVWAQDVCDFAGAMGVDKFFYAGHSHGAGIGWHICMNHPERLRGFFASGCGPHKKDGQETGAARMVTINAAKSRETWESYGRKQGEYCAKYLTSILDDPVEGEMARAAKEQMVEFWINMPEVSAIMNPRKPFPLCKTEEELAEILHKIETPILMLGGTEDTISGPDLMLRSERAVQNAKLILYRGVDHVDLPYRCMHSYARDIAAFCEEQNLL